MLDGDYIPGPSIIMFGCQSLTAVPPVPGDCPSCKKGIQPGDDHRYCGICDGLSPRREAMVKAARLGVDVKDRGNAAEKRTRDRCRAAAKTLLTEGERRRIWNGNRGGVLVEADELTNAAKLGREWLISIGQVPDWSIIMKQRKEEED